MYNEIEIVIAGTDESIVESFQGMINEYPQGMKVRRMKIEEWEEPVAIGFNMLASSAERRLRNKLKTLEKKKIRLARKKNRVKKKTFTTFYAVHLGIYRNLLGVFLKKIKCQYNRADMNH